MNLLLWRHADAAPGHPDGLRPLTVLGQAQASATARWITARLDGPFRLLVSPALRTQQTAQALAHPIETADALSVGRSAQEVLEAAGWPDARGTVIVVGHQPTLGQIAALLLSGKEHEWPMATSAACLISSEGEKPSLRANYEPSGA